MKCSSLRIEERVVEATAEKGMKLFGMWCSPISLSAEWALVLKGVEYEHVEEDIVQEKSDELLPYNPVTKKIPVLVHDGKAMAESFVIIEHVDEVRKDGYPIMPKDPCERVQARFWAKFAEDKALSAIFYLGEEPPEPSSARPSISPSRVLQAPGPSQAQPSPPSAPCTVSRPPSLEFVFPGEDPGQRLLTSAGLRAPTMSPLGLFPVFMAVPRPSSDPASVRA